MKLTKQDLTRMKYEKAYEGFGYLGHEKRNEWTDEKLLKAANELNLSYADLFLYANSRPARHTMDVLSTPTTALFIVELKIVLKILKKEKN